MVESLLELRMLGGLEVRRAGKPLALPPSKKTRALLAYLALTGRSHRREALTNLLWDVADDPRGALRWSLSKLRKQVDDAGATRLQTEGERVAIELHGASVDVLEMRRALGEARLEPAPTALLESWCTRCTGELLEGLDLPDFDGYQSWLVAEREQTRKLHANALEELVRRSDAAPEGALPHARAWVGVDPMSTPARLALIRLTLGAGQVDEAKRQFQSARRLFSELDPNKETQLVSAWQTLRATPAASGARTAVLSDSAPPPPERADAAPMASERDSALQLGAPRLIGRERERTELMETLAKVARKHRAQIVLLTGEPGIGKSRLLAALMAESRALGSAVLDGAAFEAETGRPYGPWIDALRKLARTHPAAVPRERLAPLLEAADSRASSRDALFSGVVEVLSGLAEREAPVLVVLDDVHWLDEGSAELLHYTARLACDRPVLFVLAARDAELHDQQNVLRVLRSLRRDHELRELELTRLPAEATRALVAEVDRNADAERVFAHSGGNPLFALELARAGAAAESARTVADAVRDRVARLPADAGEVLRWGALLGSEIDPRLLAALSSLSPEQQLDGLEVLERHALLRHEPGDGCYVFSHEVVRGVIYADLSQPRRTLMHHRAAEALCRLQEESLADFDEDVVARIARHADLGQGHALAASAYIAAGKRCLKLFASENASAMVKKGMRHARELPEPARSRSLLELFDVQLWARRPEDEESFCSQVLALSETALEHGCVEHARLGFNMLSYVRWEGGQWDEARKQMLKAEQVVRTGEGADHIEALAEAARCLGLLERDLGHAAAMLSEAHAHAKRLNHESWALDDADALLKQHRGEFDEADALFARARVRARAATHRFAEIQALMNRVQLNFDAARFELARELALEALELADKTRDGSEGPFARVLVALPQLALGEDALPALEDALERLRVADSKHRLTYGLIRAAALLNRQRQPARARALAEEGLEIARFLERPSDVVLALAELARAQLALAEGDGYQHSRRELSDDKGSRLSVHARRAREALFQEQK